MKRERFISRFRGLAAVFAAAILLSCFSLRGLAADPQSIRIGIYTTTDMHGRCYNRNPITGAEVKDSLLKAASAVKAERATVDGSILIDNGDLIQGTPITSYNINVEGGRENPMALCLRYSGYDAFVLGNHEFNYTMQVQDIFYGMLGDTTGKYPGTPVNVLCANYIDIATQQVRMTPYIIRTFTIGGREFRVGVVGFGNVNVPNWDLPSHYEGADFVHSDNIGRTYAHEWTVYWQKQLLDVEKCDVVIAAVHTGEGSVGADGSVRDLQNQIRHLVANTSGIDVVIGGHDHSAEAGVLKNEEGEDVVFLNGGGTTLAKVILTLKSDGSLSLGAPENLNLADYQNDAGLEALMKPYYDKTMPFVSERIGTLAGKWDSVTDYYTTQGDTYDLVQKAQIWATGADVSITTPVANRGFALSGLFAAGADTAAISLKDCYSFYKYDNNLLYMIEMTGKQLKDWLEYSAGNYSIRDGKVAGGNFGTDIAYGVDYDVYVGNPKGSRVQNVMYKGKPLSDGEILKVALSSYRLSANELGDAYGWYATTGITIGNPKVLWDASVSEQFGAVGGSVPLIIGEYIKAITAQGMQVVPERETHFRVLAEAN